jgi:hypothetical protein
MPLALASGELVELQVSIQSLALLVAAVEQVITPKLYKLLAALARAAAGRVELDLKATLHLQQMLVKALQVRVFLAEH